MKRAEQIQRLQQLRSNFEGLLQDVIDADEYGEMSGKWEDYKAASQDLERWLRQHHDEFPPSPPRHRTRDEIEALKAEWLADPNREDWFIEDTPGFDCHSPELLAFRLQTELESLVSEFIDHTKAVWECDGTARLAQASAAMNIAIFVRGNIDRIEVKP